MSVDTSRTRKPSPKPMPNPAEGRETTFIAFVAKLTCLHGALGVVREGEMGVPNQTQSKERDISNNDPGSLYPAFPGMVLLPSSAVL